MKTTTRRTTTDKRKKTVKPWWMDTKHMAALGRRLARGYWKPNTRNNGQAVFENNMADVLDDAEYDADDPGAEDLYERAVSAVQILLDAYEEEWSRLDDDLEARVVAVGNEQAFREAWAFVDRRDRQAYAARKAVAEGHRITYAVEDAMNAAGFWLTSQGGGVYSYERRAPDGTAEFIVASRDHNPPTSLSEAVGLVREDADGQPVSDRSFRTLRQALATSNPRATATRARRR